MNSFHSSFTRNGAWLGCERTRATAPGASNACVFPKIVFACVSNRLGSKLTTQGLDEVSSW